MPVLEIEGVDGMKVVEYLGGNYGTEIYVGAGSPLKRYSFGASKRKQFVPDVDADYLTKTYWKEGEPLFRIVPDETEPEPAPTMESVLVDEPAADEPAADEPAEVTFPSVIGHSVDWLEKEIERGDKTAEILGLMLDEEESSTKPRKTAVKLLNAAILSAMEEEE